MTNCLLRLLSRRYGDIIVLSEDAIKALNATELKIAITAVDLDYKGYKGRGAKSEAVCFACHAHHHFTPGSKLSTQMPYSQKARRPH